MKKWDNTEDAVLQRCITLSADNIRVGIEKASQILGRSPNACRLRWYDKLSKQTESVCFVLKSKENSKVNKKNKARKKEANKKMKKGSFIQCLFRKLSAYFSFKS